MGRFRLLVSFLLLAGLAGCAGPMRVSPSATSPAALLPQAGGSESSATAGLGDPIEVNKVDMNMEAAVSQGCVEAWRKALAGDEKTALKQLDDLEKHYPNIGTISMMRGQIYSRSDNPKEAIKAFRDAVKLNEFDSFNRFKLGEALSRSGDNKGAIVEYRRLLKAAPDFTDGKISLARALIAVNGKDYPEAKQQIVEVLKLNPDQQQLKEVLKVEPDNKEARAMLSQAK